MAITWSIAIGIIVVVGICIQFAVALYHKSSDAGDIDDGAGKDFDAFAVDVEQQLQSELKAAIKLDHHPHQPEHLAAPTFPDAKERTLQPSSTPFTSPHHHHTRSLLPTPLTKQPLPLLLTHRVPEEATGSPSLSNSSSNHTKPTQEPQLNNSNPLQPPQKDHHHPVTFLVNAKQFHRILKRRLARQKLEELLGSSRPAPKPVRNGGVGPGCMRRPRGPDGRFLTNDDGMPRWGEVR